MLFHKNTKYTEFVVYFSKGENVMYKLTTEKELKKLDNLSHGHEVSLYFTFIGYPLLSLATPNSLL